MSALSEMLLPTGFLVIWLNVVVASFAVCTISVVASWRSARSLPVRHALLVAGLSVVLLLPLAVPLCPLPAVWSIGISETLDRPRPSPIDQQFDRIQFENSEAAVSRSLSAAETQTVGPSIATPAVIPQSTDVARQTSMWIHLFTSLPVQAQDIRRSAIWMTQKFGEVESAPDLASMFISMPKSKQAWTSPLPTWSLESQQSAARFTLKPEAACSAFEMKPNRQSSGFHEWLILIRIVKTSEPGGGSVTCRKFGRHSHEINATR
jgi:hypothetical protein